MVIRLLMRLKFLTTFSPKQYPAPLLLTCQSSMSREGSDHIKSQRLSFQLISTLRSKALIWSRVLMLGERPPWIHSTQPSIMAPTGRKLKASMKYSQTLVLPNLFLTSSQKPQWVVTSRHSWLPLNRVMWLGYFTLKQNSKTIVSTE